MIIFVVLFVILELLFLVDGYTHQPLCDPGYFCTEGMKRPCPAGRFGAGKEIRSQECDGYCALGYYCPEASVSPTQYKCGDPSVFCPPGSTEPQHVHYGYYSVLGESDETRGAERKCEPGFYCLNGIRQMCSPGFWGGDFGEAKANCSGPCAPGYYCPLGSLSPTEVMCGDSARYCPGGDFAPIYVSTGYYTVGGNDSTRTGQKIAPPGHYAVDGHLYVCPAGYFGATEGLSTPECSGRCQVPGFYCPPGSVSPVQKFCGGNDYYCPANVVAPIRVHSGFYTADYEYDDCPPGQWRQLTYNYSDVTIPADGQPIVTLFADHPCQLCPEGTFKSVVGNNQSLCLPCPTQTATGSAVSIDSRITCRCTEVVDPQHVNLFDIASRQCVYYTLSEAVLLDASSWVSNTAVTRYTQYPCEPGYYCTAGLRYKCPAGRYGEHQQETNPQCSGICAAGYFCLKGSSSAYSYQCGGAEWICAEGASKPVKVPPGYYSNEDAPEMLRSYQRICPTGYFCPGDGRRYPCAAGTYTDREGTVSSQCMGVCQKGYYCTEGSSSPTQNPCGNSTVYCPRGSAQPNTVHDGFYVAHTGVDGGEQELWDPENTTASVEIPCEPGYYCIRGVKYPCPPGYFGWRYGMTTKECGGKCAAGYYCPSYLTPQLGAPSFTHWPLKPHTVSATAEFECGGVDWYCPLGTSFPLKVGGGNYSVGGNANNRTRHAEVVCSPGSYCLGSISILCPPGRYGSTSGLKDPSCTAGCPAGFYCPSGTVTPIACPPTQYSTGLVAECSDCPGGRTTPLSCQTAKACCFRA